MIVILFPVCYNLFQSLMKTILHAAVAELADAYDSKSYGKPYGFESHQRQFRCSSLAFSRRVFSMLCSKAYIFKKPAPMLGTVQTFSSLYSVFFYHSFLTGTLVLLLPYVIEEHNGTDHHDNADKVCKYCKGQ